MKYIKENLKEFETCNIPLWHSLGYTGKGVKIANFEKCSPESPIFEGKISSPFNYVYSSIRNTHGNQTASVIHQIAPDAEIYALRESENEFRDESLPFMIEHNICIGNISASRALRSSHEKEFMKMKEHGITVFVSAGNDGTNGLLSYAKSDAFLAIGAIGYRDWKEPHEIFLKDYSSRGTELDYTMFSGLYIYDFEEPSNVYEVNGTSFSSPMFTGMMALVQQFFVEKIGRTLWRDEIELFLNDHLMDLGEQGWDEHFGHGLFVLPHPNDIDINKYLIRGKKKEVNDMVFKDVDYSRWYGPAVRYVEENNLMKGDDKGNFNGDKPLTRYEMAQILMNMGAKSPQGK